VLLVTVGQGVFRGLQNMRAPLLVTLATNGLHLGLDLLLMFHMGMGIRGAAISTAASEWLAAGAYCWLVWQRRDVLALWPPPRVPLHEARRRMLPFLQAGTAVVMRTGSLLGTKTLATAVAARLGPGAVASHQVLMQLWVLSSMLVDSLAVSGQTLIAVNLGKGEAGTARQISERLLQLGFGVGVGMALLSGASASWWPQLFTTGETAGRRTDGQALLLFAPDAFTRAQNHSASTAYAVDGTSFDSSAAPSVPKASLSAPLPALLPSLCVYVCLSADDGILGQINQLVPLAVLPLPINSLVYTLDGVLVGASDFGWVPAHCCCCCSCLTVLVPPGALFSLLLCLEVPVGGCFSCLQVGTPNTVVVMYVSVRVSACASTHTLLLCAFSECCKNDRHHCCAAVTTAVATTPTAAAAAVGI
jgi:Na+-driven multidrug efflux pump